MSPALAEMFDELGRGPVIYRPSEFWREMNRANLGQLRNGGLDTFKRTLALNYFTWSHNMLDQLVYVARRARPSDWAAALRGLHRPTGSLTLNRRRQVLVGAFTRLLWRYAERRDPLGLLARLEEPEAGGPLDIRLGGRLVSQDLANSVLEFYSVVEGFRPGPASEVCELGAGYGRTAYVFVKATGCRYTVVDIPPALFVSQHYLSRVFPEKKVFRFRPFAHFAEVREEFEAADVRFLLPHQAGLLPPKRFDLFLNISSLHEMRPEQIGAYFGLIDRLTGGYFYTKQWEDTVNAADGVRIRRSDYPVPASWRALYARRARVQTRFFEAMYEVGGRAL